MKVTWLGTATLRIEADGGAEGTTADRAGGVRGRDSVGGVHGDSVREAGNTAVLFDPYRQPLGENHGVFRARHLDGVEAIFITHPHFDHFHGIDRIMARTDAPVFVCERGIEIARKCGYPASRMTPIRAGQEIRIGSLTVCVHQGRHVKFDSATVRGVVARTLRNGQAEQALRLAALNRKFSIGEKDIFIYEVIGGNTRAPLKSRESAAFARAEIPEMTSRKEKAGECRIVLLGSAGDLAPDCALKDADLLIFPYAGRSDMAGYAWEIIREYHAKRVMLDHFDDAFPPFTAAMDCEALRLSSFAKPKDCEAPRKRMHAEDATGELIIPKAGEMLQF